MEDTGLLVSQVETQIVVLFFGGLKEALACDRDVVAFASDEPPRLAGLYAKLLARHTNLPRYMGAVRLAINEEFVGGTGQSALQSDIELVNRDTVAFIPPVTGG